MNETLTERLYNLLPAIYRIRDDAYGQPLRALLAVIEQEVQALQEDIEGLYANRFIETCDEWVVPYIGQLLGIRGLHPGLPGTFSLRAFVANTLAYRRRKGTAAMLEQLTRDTTGWNARAVEYFELVRTTQHINHFRAHRKSTPDLRQADALQLLETPFDTISHTADIRPIARQRGKHNLDNVGLFLWRLTGYVMEGATARAMDDPAGRRYTFSPLGCDTPLFNRPQAETEITHLAEEINVPGRLRRRPLYRELETHRQALVEGKLSPVRYFGRQPVLEVFLGREKDPLPPEEIIISDLSGWDASGWVPPSSEKFTRYDSESYKSKVAVDPELGRLVLLDIFATAATELNDLIQTTTLLVRGYTIDITGTLPDGSAVSGIFTYDTDGTTLGDLLARIDTVYDGEVVASVEDGKILVTDVQAGASNTTLTLTSSAGIAFSTFGVSVEGIAGTIPRMNILAADYPLTYPSRLRVSYAYGFSGDIGGGPYDRWTILLETRPEVWFKKVSKYDPQADYQNLTDAIAAWRDDADALNEAVITIIDNGIYTENIDLNLNAGDKLVIQAGNRYRPTLRLVDDQNQVSNLKIQGADPTGATLTLDGLLIEGAIEVLDNSLEHIRIIHCTLIPGRAVNQSGKPWQPEAASIFVEPPSINLTLEIDHSIVGPLLLPESLSRLTVTDSIIDAQQAMSYAIGPVEDESGNNKAYGPLTTLERTTILGGVRVRELPLASEVIFDGKVRVERRQTGCVRFSYLSLGSRVPRKYRCQPELALKQRADELDLETPADLPEEEKNRIVDTLRPDFSSRRYGHMDYAQLSLTCPTEISTGAENGSEMGAFHHLMQPQREANLRASLNDFLRFGLDAGIYYVT